MMLHLLIAEFSNGGGERCIKRTGGELAVIMFRNDGFNRNRAGHGSPYAHQGGTSPKHITGHMPQGHEDSGANATLGQQAVEGGKVLLLLRGHVAQFVADGVVFEDGKLPRINPLCAIFARMVNTQSSSQNWRREIAGEAAGRRVSAG